MNTNITLLLALALAILAANAQGPLTPPPGAPAPVMKSLDQIEARTPLNTLAGDASAKHIISTPGSYYLTGPITGESGKDGIRINAANVTLDLNGYALTGVGGSNTAITLSVSGGPVAIRNGSIQTWTTGGIIGFNATHVALEDIAITGISAGPGVFAGAHSMARRISVNGAQRSGIYLAGTAGIATECTVENLGCGSWSLDPNQVDVLGIFAGIISSSSIRNVNQAGGGSADGVYGMIGTNVENCIAGNFNVPGINARGIAASTVRSCSVFDITCGASEAVGIIGTAIEGNAVVDVNGGGGRVGIEAGGYGATILNNHVTRCQIRSGSSTTIRGNRVSESGGLTGIQVYFTGCNVTENTISIENGAGSRGISISGSGHRVSDNVITTGTGGIGIRMDASRCVVSENKIVAATDAVAYGIFHPTGYSNNRIDGNTITGGSVGVIIFGGAVNPIVTRNSVSGAPTAYTLPAGTQAGPVVALDDLTTASPWANLSQP